MILFWGTSGKYGVFSNFYTCDFADNEGLKYNCNEQYFMVQKLKAFDPHNAVLLDKMLEETNPKNIKQYGRQVKNYDEKQWDMIRYDVMLKGLTLKFTQNPKLLQILMETGDKLLAEASPYDKIWGIGLGADAASNIPVAQWKGQNLLGKALMQLRASIAK